MIYKYVAPNAQVHSNWVIISSRESFVRWNHEIAFFQEQYKYVISDH